MLLVTLRARPGTFDQWIVDEVASGVYTRLFRILPSDIVADVGAHIGSFSVVAAKEAYSGVVYSFEPQPENYRALLENLELNGITNDIPANAAVGARSGVTTISSGVPFNTGGFATGTGDAVVPVVSLDETLGRLDFLKVDVEGSELDVLSGARQLLLRDRVRVALEAHGDQRKEEIVAYLNSLGYTVGEEGSGASFHGLTFMVYAWKE